MLAWNLFKKSILLISDNLGAALRVSLVPYTLLAVGSFYFDGRIDMSIFVDVAPGTVPVIPDGMLGAIWWSTLLNLFVYIWVAVGWHRYVLLAEGGTSWVAPVLAPAMLGYFGRFCLLILILVALSLVVVLVVGLVLPLLVTPILFLLALIVFYRLGLILPAGAIGQPKQLGEVWKATDGQNGTIILLALMTFALSIVLQIPMAATGEGGPGPIAILYGIVVGWIVLMIGVGVLSTLYGHFIESRPLD